MSLQFSLCASPRRQAEEGAGGHARGGGGAAQILPEQDAGRLLCVNVGVLVAIRSCSCTNKRSTDAPHADDCNVQA